MEGGEGLGAGEVCGCSKRGKRQEILGKGMQKWRGDRGAGTDAWPTPLNTKLAKIVLLTDWPNANRQHTFHTRFRNVDLHQSVKQTYHRLDLQSMQCLTGTQHNSFGVEYHILLQ